MIQHLRHPLATACLGLACLIHAAEPMAKDNIVRSGTPQPVTIPGNPITDEVPLPALGPILEKAKPNPLIYGLYCWDGEYLRLRKDIREVGWRFIRLGGRIHEGIVKQLKEDGVQTMYTFCIKTKPNPDHVTDQAFVDQYLKELIDIQKRLDLRKPQFLLECWNEPNFGYLIQPDRRPQGEQEADRYILYTKLLTATARVLKGTNLPLVGFGAGGSGAGDGRFFASVHKLDPAVAQSYDIVSTHPYVDPTPPELFKRESWGRYAIAGNLAAIREVLASHGRKDTPVWFTECGWEISQTEGGRYGGRTAAIPLTLHAAYTCRMYAYAQRLGVERVSNMFAMDTDGYNGGFFGQDGSWRPVAHAVKTMIGLMPEPKLLAVPSDGRGGLFIYQFQATAAKSSRHVVMVWNVLGPRVIELPLPTARTVVVDMLGTRQEVKVRNGILRLEAGPLPMYVVLESRSPQPDAANPKEALTTKPATQAKATAGAQARNRYVTLLKERALARALEGKGPMFPMSLMGGPTTITGGDADMVELRSGATTMQLAWKVLGDGDRANLAVGLTNSGTAEDAAIAAFWLKCAGRETEAAGMLERAGHQAAEVQASFMP